MVIAKNRQVLLCLKQHHSSSHSPAFMKINLTVFRYFIKVFIKVLGPGLCGPVASLKKTRLTGDDKVLYTCRLQRACPMSWSVTLMSSVHCLEGIYLRHRPFVLALQQIQDGGKSCERGRPANHCRNLTVNLKRYVLKHWAVCPHEKDQINSKRSDL